MPQFFLEKNAVVESRVRLKGEEAHHIRDVFRLKIGAPIRLFDGRGRGFMGRIRSMTVKDVEVQIQSEFSEEQGIEIEIVLVQSIVSGPAMDWIVQKTTELGVTQIAPVITERSQIRPAGEKALNKERHWQEVALSACKQSERMTLPSLHPIRTLEGALRDIPGEGIRILAHREQGNSVELKDVFSSKEKVKRVILFIGPEGGFTSAELKCIRKSGALSVSLGSKILKSETAALYLTSVVRYLYGSL